MSTSVQETDVFGGIVLQPDNKQGAISDLLRINGHYRKTPWPEPFAATSHQVELADARDLSRVPDESVHLVVTSPPYRTLKEYRPHESQLGAIDDYAQFWLNLTRFGTNAAGFLSLVVGFAVWLVMSVCHARRMDVIL